MLTQTLRAQFLLRDDITYLNFGSFGACAKPVFEQYQQFQRLLEEEPAQFFFNTGPALLKKSREALGGFLNCGGDDLVYVPNPSYAVNIVAKSLRLEPGDEVLTTDLEYGACERTWSYYCRKAGATLRRQKIVLPLKSPSDISEALLAGITGKTRLIFVSHLTSTTALVFPVKEICEAARKKNIPCFIDGAHAPGQLEVDLRALNADYYTGACHKWMLTPKGCAFLHVKKERQQQLDPLVVSWGYESATPSNSQFLDYHEGQGTRDYSAFLTVPAAIRFMEQHNWKNVSEECRELVRDYAPRFAELLKCTLLSPPDGRFIAQMLSLPIRTARPEELQRHLFDKHRIEIPVMRHGDAVYLRYSVNAFNSAQDLDKLYEALQHIAGHTDLLTA